MTLTHSSSYSGLSYDYQTLAAVPPPPLVPTIRHAPCSLLKSLFQEISGAGDRRDPNVVVGPGL